MEKKNLMNTEEKNDLIARFMEGNLEDNGWNFCLSDFGTNVIGGYGFYESFDLKFHKSWDWLIPVVEKINDTGVVSNINFWFDGGYFVIEAETDEEIRTFEGHQNSNTHITCIYKAVVEFIIWYNKNK